MERLISFAGLFVMMGLAWLLSSRRRSMPWRTIGMGLLLQFALAVLILRTPFGRAVFEQLGAMFLGLMRFVDIGAEFVFALNSADGSRDLRLLASFAFGTLSTIIFFSALISILYHLGIMQQVVRVAALVMRKTMNLSGAESLSVAANVFIGQVESPLVVRPYLPAMTQSELMSVMVAGFATIAGGVMAAYVRMGIDAGHLITASVVSAPAALVVSKILEPETQEPATRGQSIASVDSESVNIIDAAAQGAIVGLQLALQIGAIIIAFLALIAMGEFAVQWMFTQFGSELTLRTLLGYAFAPLAFMMGMPWSECQTAGELLGLRMISNEFIAYAEMGQMLGENSPLSQRSEILLTYALCGFANFGSIGVQLGGIGAAAPSRQADLARLGLRAMLGGMLACFMTACVAGVLL